MAKTQKKAAEKTSAPKPKAVKRKKRLVRGLPGRGKRIGKDALVRVMSRRTEMSYEKTADFIQTLFDTVAFLAQKRPVVWPGFGIFDIAEISARKAYSPIAQRWIDLPAVRRLRLRTSHKQKTKVTP